MSNDELEEWHPVPGQEGAYEISNLGQVRSLDRRVTYHLRNGKTVERLRKGRILKQPRDAYGYPVASIGGRMRFVHALVAEAFLGPRPPGMDVYHADGSRDNNHVSNLRYDTRAGKRGRRNEARHDASCAQARRRPLPQWARVHT